MLLLKLRFVKEMLIKWSVYKLKFYFMRFSPASGGENRQQISVSLII